MTLAPLRFSRLLALLVAISAAAVSMAALAQTAGTVEFAQGDVRARDASGRERPVARGTAIAVGETVVTGTQGAVQMRMVDNAFIALRSETEVNVNEYKYGAGAADENAVLRLLKGTLRTFTGRIAQSRKERFLTVTPTSTIGIRGSGNVAFYSPALGTLNHTIEGSHVTTSINAQGQPIGAPVVTLPGQTVQVLPGQPPVRVPTPPFLIQAATAAAPAPAQSNESTGGTAEQKQVNSEERSGESRSNSTADAALPAPPALSAVIATLSPATLALSVPPTVITGSTSLGTGLNLTAGTQTTSTGTTLSLSRVPTSFAGTNPQIFGSGRFAFEGFYPIGVGDPTTLGTTFIGGLRTNALTGLLSNTAFYYADTTNTAAIIGAAWNVFDRGSATQCLLGTPCLAPGQTSPADTRSIAVLSGGAIGTSGIGFNQLGDRAFTGLKENFGGNGASNITFGRYQGGQVDVFNSDGTVEVLTQLGTRSALFAIREMPTSIPLTGAWHYVPVFATAPVDTLGNLGILNFASLDVNFSSQTVNPAIGVSINNQNLTARGFRVPINANFGFNVTSSALENAALSPAPSFPLQVSCSGSNCAALPIGATGSAYGARIVGGFAGDGTASSAFFTYIFSTRYDPSVAPGSGLAGAAPLGRFANDYISGIVSFARNGLVVAPAPTPSQANYFVTYTVDFSGFASAALNTYRFPYASASFGGGGGNLNAVSLSTGSSTGVGGDLSGAGGVTSLANGISFGRYQSRDSLGSGPALTVTSGSAFFNDTNDTVSSNSSTNNTVGAFHWIQAPSLWPNMVNGALTGTLSFNSFTGAISDQNGAAGTINAATLSFDFDRQSVSAGLKLTTGANQWAVTANGLALGRDGGFGATNSGSSAPLAHNGMSATLNGVGVFGNLAGALTGALDGAALGFQVAQGSSLSSPRVNGVVAFSNPSLTLDPLVPMSMMLRARGLVPGIDGQTGGLPTSILAYQASPLENLVSTSVQTLDPARQRFNAQGALVEFDSWTTVMNSSVATPLPVRMGITAGGSAASGTIPAMPAITGTAAAIAEFGADPITGITWGRYSAGNFATVDRVTGLPIGNGSTAENAINHYLLTPFQLGPTVLPLSGSATYTLIGATSPTDTAGFVGTLNSATLNANFSAKTVDTSLAATVGPRTWSASASGVPILNGSAFEASRFGTNGTLNVSCSGAGCNPAAVAGSVTGVFVGPTGQGAGVAYSLNSGGSGGVTMGGVAAFRR